MKILVTGATGYVGGRLIPELLGRGHEVRVLVRDPRRVVGRPWAGKVDIRVGDMTRPETIRGVGDGVDAAYYLVHSMHSGSNYAEVDAAAAEAFATELARASHVIYLGGLLPRGGKAGTHLRSRAQVGEILRERLPTTEFRAGPIIGSGSASFEMVRYLTERIPIMVTPRWLRNDVQPIAVRDILAYLLAALDAGAQGVVDVGAEKLTYKEMMLQFAAIRGLRRHIFMTPVLAPRLAARWIGLMTPLNNRLAIPLVQSIVTPVLADTAKAQRVFPHIQPIPYGEAVRRALEKIRTGTVETRWSDALGGGATYELVDKEGMVREERTLHVDLPPEDVARGFMSIGGDRGWLVWEWAWVLRGWMDLIVGGPGLRRGRRHPEHLLAGEALDFWRVEEARPPGLLRLRAEMRVPGQAWLQWETHAEGAGTRLVQTALFAPRGFLGFAYWYALYPVHRFIFNDLINAVAKQARSMASERTAHSEIAGGPEALDR